MAGVVLTFALLAAAVMWPYRSSRYRSVSDLDAFIAGVVEAGNALREGQFPIRVAPHQLDGVRYPLFQFYANFPYTVSGAMFAAGLNPYTAWRLAMIAAISAGGTFTYLTAYRLTRRAPESIVAGTAYVLAPYLFTDLNARGAIAEFFALQLLPIALYATLRCLANPRKRYVTACGVAWMLVGLTHNITYLYGATFVGLLALSMIGRPRRIPGRLTRLAAAGVLHAGLMAWYVVPQIRTIPLLEVKEQIASPTGAGALTTADILFSPVLRSPPGSSTPNLGCQVGWAILAGVIVALLGVLVARRRHRFLRRVTFRLIILFAIALLMALSPFGVWDRVPRLFWFIQFPYRLLGYTSLLGAILAGCGLALWRGRGQRPRARHLICAIALAVIGAGAISYFPRARLRHPTFVRETIARPVCMGLNDYLLSGSATAATGHAHPGVELSRLAFGLVQPSSFVSGEVRERATAGLNIPPGATAIRLHGTAENAGDGQPPERVEVKLGTREFIQEMPAGKFDFTFPIDANAGSSQVFTLRPRDHVDRHVRMLLTSARYEGAEPATRRLILAEDAAKDVRLGRNTRFRFATPDPVLLQLPVLYYPGLLRVRDEGKEIPFANLGRYVAVELPPGTHSIAVRFDGVGWANLISGIAWAVVGGSVVVTIGRSWIRRQRATKTGASTSRDRRPVRWTIGEAVLACLAVSLGGSIALATRAVRERMATASGAPTAVASRSDDAHPPGHAVDGRPDTVWHVNGPDPARLTITLPAPRTVRGLRLHARRTALMEVWQQVNLSCFLADWPAIQKTVGLPNAARQDATEIKFAEPLRLDRLDMEFFDPVVERADGERVPPQLLNPGYAEVELLE